MEDQTPFKPEEILLLLEKAFPNDFQAYNHLCDLMDDLTITKKIIELAMDNEQHRFVAVETLSKKLTKYSYISIKELVQDKIAEKTFKLLIDIANILLNSFNRHNAFMNSIYHAVSLILKIIFEVCSSYNKFFPSLFEMFPFHIEDLENAYLSQQKGHVHVREMKLGKVHEEMLTVFTLVLQNSLSLSQNTQFLLTQWSITAMKVRPLPYMLGYAVYYVKTFFQLTNGNIQELKQTPITLALKLLEDVLTYPFNFDEIDPQHFESCLEDIYGLENVTNNPYFYKLFLEEEGKLVQDIIVYYRQKSVNGHYDLGSKEAISIVRIICRLLCSQVQVQASRQNSEKINRVMEQFRVLCDAEKTKNTYTRYVLLQTGMKICACICQKRNNTHNQLHETKEIFKIFYRWIQENEIKIEDGNRNIISKVSQCFRYIQRQKIWKTHELNGACKDIAEVLLVKMSNQAEISKCLNQFGLKNQQEIECFTEIFQHFIEIFNCTSQHILPKMKERNFDQLNPAQKVVWLHFGSVVILGMNQSLCQTEITLKFLNLAMVEKSTAAATFLSKLVNNLFKEIRQGKPQNTIWYYLEENYSFTMPFFVEKILEYCFRNLQLENKNTVKKSIDIIEQIYSKLLQNECEYHIIHTAGNKIYYEGSKILNKPEFYCFRKNLLKSITPVFKNKKYNEFIQFYRNICSVFKQNEDKMVRLQKYFIDITGLLMAYEKFEDSKILIELITIEFEVKLNRVFTVQKYIKKFFQKDERKEAFVEMALQVTEKVEKQSNQALKLEQLFFKPIDFIMRNLVDEDEKRFKINLMKLTKKFIRMNPLNPLPYLSSVFLKLKTKGCYSLIEEYFECIERLKNEEEFEQLEKYIQLDEKYFQMFWARAMETKMVLKREIRMNAAIKIRSQLKKKEELPKIMRQIKEYLEAYRDL